MLGNRKVWMIALAAVLLGTGGAQAQIKVGITMSGAGPGAALGQPQTKTVAALPKEIAGQKITYFALDDESDPTKGAQNARKLITEEKAAVPLGSPPAPARRPVGPPVFRTPAGAQPPLPSLAAAAVLGARMNEERKWVFKVGPND